MLKNIELDTTINRKRSIQINWNLQRLGRAYANGKSAMIENLCFSDIYLQSDSVRPFFKI